MTSSTADAAMAPTICATTYPGTSAHLHRPATARPTVTAGLMWQPEIGPIAYAIATSAKPNASEMPSGPSACPSNTAEPTPTNTSTNVPTSSAKYRFIPSSEGFDVAMPVDCGTEQACPSRSAARGPG